MEEFLSWWAAGLRDSIPARWRKSLAARHRFGVIEIREDRLTLGTQDPQGNFVAEVAAIGFNAVSPRSRAQIVSWIQRARRRGLLVLLNVVDLNVLTKTLTLPLATEENLREAIAFQMDRQSPYRAEDVYFDVRIVGRNSATQRLQAQLTLVPRRSLVAPLAILDRFGIHSDALLVRVGADAVNVPLKDTASARSAREPRVKLRRALSGAICALGAVALLLPVWTKLQYAKAMEQEIASVHNEAVKAGALRRELDAIVDRERFIIEKRNQTPRIVDVLNELTHRLPDTVWLQQLDLRDGALNLQGEAVSATNVIELLSASHLLHNLAFRAPVQSDPETDRERFNLGASLPEKSP